MLGLATDYFQFLPCPENSHDSARAGESFEGAGAQTSEELHS